MRAQSISGRFRSAVRTLLKGVEAPAPVAQAAISPPTRTPLPTRFLEAGQAINARGIFVGCPLDCFELTARDPLCLALMEGLKRDSSVLEVGCGCLRVGFWFIDFLDPGKYCGIEPNAQMLDAGRELILGDRAGEKQPRFSLNADFDFGVFGTAFDYVVAFSIWSHASKGQILTMLDAFRRTARPGARFLASWFVPREHIPDYYGEAWVGRSHQSDQPGVVGHQPDWIMASASSRGLNCRFFEGFTTLGQRWAIVTHP